MNFVISKVFPDLKFDSCGEPQMKLCNNILEVSFPIFLNNKEASIEIFSLLNKYKFQFNENLDIDEIYQSLFLNLDKQGLNDKMELLDSIYNNSGWRMLSFKFKVLDYIFCGSRESITEKYINFSTVFNEGQGIYEEKDLSEKRKSYIIIGHDISLIIATNQDFYNLKTKKFSEINQL